MKNAGLVLVLVTLLVGTIMLNQCSNPIDNDLTTVKNEAIDNTTPLDKSIDESKASLATYIFKEAESYTSNYAGKGKFSGYSWKKYTGKSGYTGSGYMRSIPNNDDVHATPSDCAG